MNDEQLTQRMRTASDAIEMSDSAQAQHLEAISAALAVRGDASDATLVALPSAGVGRHRRIVASVVAAAVIAPAGLAAASEGSIPGDALYPVKQLSEQVLVLFDSDVIARHRIEEIEALDTAGRFDPELYANARAALEELREDHPLWERLAASTEAGDSDDRGEAIVDDDDRSEVEPAEESSVEPEVTNRDEDLDDDDTPSTATVPNEDESDGESSEGDDSAVLDDDASEGGDTETTTAPEGDSGDGDDEADSGDDDPEGEADDPGDDDPSEDA
jgi:hypothetical protein